MKLSPDRSASSYMAVFRAIVGPVTALAAVLGGWRAGESGTGSVEFGGLALEGLKILFLISCAGRLASLVLLSGVAEREARSVRYVMIAAMRAWRLAWRRRKRRLTFWSPPHPSRPQAAA